MAKQHLWENFESSSFWIDVDSLHPARIDAWYYQPQFIENNKRLQDWVSAGGGTLRRLSGLASVTYGYMPTEDYWESTNGAPFLRVTNFTANLFTNLSDLKYVNPKAKENPKFTLKFGDTIVVQCGNTTGRIAFVSSDIEGFVFPSFCLRVRSRDRGVNPFYLVALFDTSAVQTQIQRTISVTSVRPNTTKPALESIMIPIPDRRIQDYIGAKVELAERCRAEAANTYNQALKRFDILLDSRHFHPRIGLTNKIDISRLTQRLNGEFYLPRYFDLEEHLASLSIKIDIIGNLVRAPIIRTSTPKRDEEAPIPCILTSDIDPQQINSHQPSLRITPDVHEFHAGKLESYDVVYTSVGPPVGEAAVVLPQHLPMAVGGDVSVIRTTKDLHPGFLCLYLNSVYGQMQNDRYSRGIRQRRVYPEDIGSFLIPIPKRSDQEYIGDRIIKYELFNEVALGLVAEAKSDIEALIEGTIDTNAILSGKLKPPTWETINESLGSGTDE